jgi:hypothetical protein
MTAEQLAEILEVGFNAAREKAAPELTAAQYAMAQKAREIAAGEDAEPSH